MKRISAISLTLVTAFLLYFAFKMLPDIYLNAGQKAYDNKNYQEAFSSLKTAVKLAPKNKDIRYYYVQTLVKLPPTLDVQKELYKISQVNLGDSADMIADRQISMWRNQITLNVGDNYIEQVPFDNKILRWDLSKLPLNVCIKNDSPNNVPAYYQTAINKAFLQWQSSTGFLQFDFVDNPSDAQILITLVASGERKDCKESCKYVVAYTTPLINGDLLDKMEITFYDSNNLGQPFSEREIYNTALHEIGHSLGIMGHSYSKNDLMYMEYNSNENYDKFRSDFQLISQSDLNTIGLLYKLIPEITNTQLSTFDTSHQFFSPIVIGDDKQINSRKMLEAKNYIDAAPNLPNGYIDLASAYAEQKEYNSAIEALNKALELSSNDNERFIIYYNFTIIYMNIKDWDNALKYAELAKQAKPQSADEINGPIAAINFNKGNIDAAKQIYIETLAKDPTRSIDAINLAIIYIKQYNFAQAGKTLNKLVAANPEERNNPKVKAFGLLMFFFR